MFCPKCGNQNPDGALFCTNCGEKFLQEAVEAVQEAAAPVQETVTEAVQEAAAPVVEAAAPVVEAAAPVVDPAPVQQPVQQPVYQQPVQQPVYQQPVQQPVYQQPVYQQPVYQQPMYQQPAFQQPAPKKKSKAPLIITLIIVLLVLAAGGLIAYETFLASEEDRPEWLAALDFKKEGNSLPLSDKEQSTFKKLVKALDEAIIDEDGGDYADGIPSYARDFVWSVYGKSSAKEFVTYLNEDEDNGIASCGDDIKVTEEIVSAKKISDLDDLTDCFKDVFGKSVDIAAAYLVANNSCFKGSDGSEKYFDYYIFFEEDDEWQVILIGEDNLGEFNLKK